MEKEYTLIVNSVEDFIQVAVGEEEKLISGIEARSQKKGIVLLPRMIVQCMEIAGIDLSKISRIGCVTGPGSFTGIRIALSICSAIVMTKKIPIGEINYLKLLAQNAFKTTKGNLFVLKYARINLLYVQGFSGPDPLIPLTKPMVCSVNKVKDFLANYSSIKVVGSGVRKYRELFDENIVVLDPLFDRPSLALLVEHASTLSYKLTLPEPLYLRPSDAEENFEKIAKNRGLV